jgi:hypothetical protein
VYKLKIKLKQKQTVQRIMSGRRISLPEWFMEENKLKVGDWVLIQEVGKALRIVPAVIIPKYKEGTNQANSSKSQQS